MKKSGLIWTLLVIIGILLGCGEKDGEENILNVMLFTELPFEYYDYIETYFEEAVNLEEMVVEVQMFLPSPEKLTIEMVAGNGDIYIVDESMYNIIFDPVILHPLDTVVKGMESDRGNMTRFRDVDENTGKEHLYAIPINNDSPFLQDLQLETSSPLLAVMMEGRPTAQFGLDILTEMNH